MKLPFIKSSLIVSSALAIIASGCLKDKAYDNGEIQSLRNTGVSPKVVEIKLTAGSTDNFLSVAYDNSTNDTTVELVPINLATRDPAPQDINVTVALDSQLVITYNTENGTSYEIPSSAIFSVVNPVVTIPSGSHTGFLKVKINPSNYLGKAYAVGFTISSVAESGYVVSGNNKNGVVAINIKNEFDGNYHVFGTRVHPTLGPFPFDYNADLNTVGEFSNKGNVLADLLEGLTITVNPDNTVSLTGELRDVILVSGKENKYDPATKTFILNYYYNTAAPRVITETLVRNP
jgi:hypothetical protein